MQGSCPATTFRVSLRGFPQNEHVNCRGLDGEGLLKRVLSMARTYAGRARFANLSSEVWKDGELLGGIETKVGRSRYLPSQRAKDWYLRKTTGYIVDVSRVPHWP
jgi:hypothetical protein